MAGVDKLAQPHWSLLKSNDRFSVFRQQCRSRHLPSEENNIPYRIVTVHDRSPHRSSRLNPVACFPGSNSHCVVKIVSLFCFVFFWSMSDHLEATEWREITEQEFAYTEPQVDPEYGAEYLFSESVVRFEGAFGLWQMDRLNARTIQVYERIKVFNQLGIEQILKTELSYYKGNEIRDLACRTVKMDGSSYELDESSIYDVDQYNRRKFNLRAKTFAFPDLEPGDIVDIRYTRNIPFLRGLFEFEFIKKLPAQRVSYKIKPYHSGVGVKFNTYLMPDADITPDKSGYYEFELLDVPARTYEPYAVPRIQSEPYVILYYFRDEPREKRYWEERAKNLYHRGRSSLKPRRELSHRLDSVTEHASSDLERLELAYYFCQNEIINLDYPRGKLTSIEIEELKTNQSSRDTLKRGYGTPEDIRKLFGSMARALGFRVEYADVNDNGFLLFNENTKAGYMLPDTCIAVEIKGQFEYFNPGKPYLPFGQLDWWNRGSLALIGQSKGYEFRDLPMPRSDVSRVSRTGRFEIGSNGNLDGTVELEFSGFRDQDLKRYFLEYPNLEDRIEYIQRGNLINPNAIILNFRVQNEESSSESTFVQFDLEIPEYADLTKRRLIVQPAVFQKENQPIFTSDERHYDIAFDYPWSESDNIEIKIAEDYSFEEGNSASPVDLGELGHYVTNLSLAEDHQTLLYNREFALDLFYAPKEIYRSIKTVFEYINRVDQLALTFSREDPESHVAP